MNLAEKVITIIALTQLFKFFGAPSVTLPFIAMIMGGLVGFLGKPNISGVLEGIFLGAVCTGTYGVIKNAAKSLLNRTKKNPNEDLEADDDRGE